MDLVVDAAVLLVLCVDRPEAKPNVACCPPPAGRMPDHNVNGASVFVHSRMLFRAFTFALGQDLLVHLPFTNSDPGFLSTHTRCLHDASSCLHSV